MLQKATLPSRAHQGLFVQHEKAKTAHPAGNASAPSGHARWTREADQMACQNTPAGTSL
jgi:hypothetical protein